VKSGPKRRWSDRLNCEDDDQGWRRAMHERDRHAIYSRDPTGPILVLLWICYLGGMLAVFYLVGSWIIDFVRGIKLR
jgi:hypothetical protein